MLERFFVEILIWGSDRRHLKGLVSKNLYAHAARNRKTATMFTIALAFIIFVGTSMALQGSSIQDNVQVGLGGDIVVWTFNIQTQLDELPMRDFLDAEMARRNAGDATAKVLGYSFRTFPFDDLAFAGRSYISNLAGTPDRRARLVGLSENYLANTYDKFYLPTESAAGLSLNQTIAWGDESVQIFK